MCSTNSPQGGFLTGEKVDSKKKSTLFSGDVILSSASMATHALASASFAPARAYGVHADGISRRMLRNARAPVVYRPRHVPRATDESSEATTSTSSSDRAEDSTSASQAGAQPEYQGPPRVVVLGGGFGGLYTALKLDALDGWKDQMNPKVTLIDKATRFVFKPMLYELVNETMRDWEVCPEFVELLKPTDVRFRNAQVVDVKPDNPVDVSRSTNGSDPSSPGSAGGVVILDDGSEVPYDYLVIGIGAAVGDGGRVPGAKEHAIPLNSFEDAQTLAGALRDMETKRIQVNESGNKSSESSYVPRVAVVGGGYAGCELAGVIAERLNTKNTQGDVHLFAGSIFGVLPNAPNGQRESTIKRLNDLGVMTIAGARATAVRSDDSNESSTSKQSVEPSTRAVLAWKSSDLEEHLSSYDAVCWTVGLQIECPASWPFTRDERSKKIKTDKALRAVGYKNVFAVGDVACVGVEESFETFKRALMPGDAGYEESIAKSSSSTETSSTSTASPPPSQPLPATAQVAFQQADYAAWNVWSTVNKRPVLPFKYQHIGDMMTTGVADAAVALPIGDATVDGVAGAALRRAAYLYRMPTDEHRAKLASEWVKQGIEQVYEKGASKTLEDWGIEVPEVFKQLEKALPPLPKLPGLS